MDAVDEASKSDTPVIADGGMKFPAISPRRRSRAECAMIGALLAGTEEAPAKFISIKAAPINRIAAWARSVPWRAAPPIATFQQDIKDALKLVPEGVEGQVPFKGPLATVLHQLTGGVRAAMGYVGAKSLKEFREKAQFVRISGSALRESHVHDVTITREKPKLSDPRLISSLTGERIR